MKYYFFVHQQILFKVFMNGFIMMFDRLSMYTTHSEHNTQSYFLISYNICVCVHCSWKSEFEDFPENLL